MAGPIKYPNMYPYGVKTLTPGQTVVEALDMLGPESSFRLEPLESSMYITPKAAMYNFRGKERRWDVVESHASVGVVLYHKDLDAWIIVRQFRPAVYATLMREAEAAGKPKPPYSEAFTYELCAGLIDKDKSNPEICKEEIMEECGFDVPLEGIHEIGVGIASAGTQGCPHIMYYAEVDSSMAVAGAGGGLLGHGECIEVLALPFESCQQFVLDGKLPKSPGLMFGITWAYFNKLNGSLGAPRVATTSGTGLQNGELVLQSVLPA
ncbi:hypothetical protein CHLRE_11g467524v5 [Chlamydomonas reinhardtii]|uniref:Uridine diphosphate glucose pyrophosphatase NUDT14 n=1 Tax=Chlamydomonas reinhardtii TaxID=3055 RepID=A0A2K3D761_CHLRE|nr:uncharacterized protein CHLRE_11g467524v5 [Chlamydomonas reinhardtii]PNW76364.1 hypothetical protein CHLRE_11g467524v5 [Chlamydomonas reinhardtii]